MARTESPCQGGCGRSLAVASLEVDQGLREEGSGLVGERPRRNVLYEVHFYDSCALSRTREFGLRA